MRELGLEEDNLADHVMVESRPASQLGTARAPIVVNPVLAELLEQDKRNPDPIDVSEVRAPSILIAKSNIYEILVRRKNYHSCQVLSNALHSCH